MQSNFHIHDTILRAFHSPLLWMRSQRGCDFAQINKGDIVKQAWVFCHTTTTRRWMNQVLKGGHSTHHPACNAHALLTEEWKESTVPLSKEPPRRKKA